MEDSMKRTNVSVVLGCAFSTLLTGVVGCMDEDLDVLDEDIAGDEAPESGAPLLDADLAGPLPAALVVVDRPSSSEATAGDIEPQGTDCGGIFNPCGILNNRTSRWLEVSRDSASSLYCDARGPYGWVEPGRNSNQNPPGFKDTDCFRSWECSVFYAGILHPPGDWVRIRTSVFIYNLGC
jgi:hypothetical protein